MHTPLPLLLAFAGAVLFCVLRLNGIKNPILYLAAGLVGVAAPVAMATKALML